jgi:hypothetical protein
MLASGFMAVWYFHDRYECVAFISRKLDQINMHEMPDVQTKAVSISTNEGE